jgi:hypothetical protein
MKKIVFILFIALISLISIAQDTTIINADTLPKKPVKIFNTERVILNNTTEPVGKGKMQFLVTHYFDDIAGNTGGLKNFFGLDNSTDVRIGFNVGLSDRLDVSIARAKSGHPRPELRMEKIYELGFKYQLMRQMENDPSHPLAVSFFFSNIISAMDTAKTAFFDFKDFGDRMSQVYQLIIARKMGRVSVQLLPTLVRQGYLIPNDLQRTMFALGGTLRFPLFKDCNFIVDYVYPFRSEESENAFKSTMNFSTPIKFYNPLGIGFEIITTGHVFHLNFTNATQIQEARFIPYNVKSWGKGQYRWGFTIARTFVLWRDKSYYTNW